MTVNEMHIAVNLGVQKIASFQVDNLLPQEIDHELNLAMIRFIKNRYGNMSNRMGKGFEQSQKRIDDLRTLVVENTDYTSSTNVPVFTSNYSDIYVDRYTLPRDYMFLISVRAQASYLCNQDVTDLIRQGSGQEGYKTIFRSKVDLTPPAPGYVLTGLFQFNSGVWQQISTGALGDELTPDELRDDASYIGGITSEVSLPNQSNGSTFTLDSNHMFLISMFPFTQCSSGVGSGAFIRSAWCLPGNYTSAQFKYEYSLTNDVKNPRWVLGGDARVSLAKFAQHDDVYYILNDPFNKGNYLMPFYNVEETAIDIYTDHEFTAPKVTIKYIRKPNAISITNGIGCELPDHTHTEIIEMTIKSILEGVQDPRYQTQSMETLESE